MTRRGEQRRGWGWARWPPIPDNGTYFDINTKYLILITLPSVSSHLDAMRDSLVASNPCQRPTLHPSLANTRRRSHFHSTPRDGEGFPLPVASV